MSSPALAIPIYYIRQIADEIGAMGRDAQQWLKRNGLDPHRLGDASEALSFAVFRRLILEAIQLTGEPALGLRVGARLRLNAHGVLGYAAMNSATLRQTAELFERYTPLRTPLVATSVKVLGRDFRIVYDEPYPLGDIRKPFLEAVVLTLKNVIDQVSDGQPGQPGKPVRRVAFAYPAPDYSSRYEAFFQCPVDFGQAWTGLVLPLALIDRPLVTNDPISFREADSICRREMEDIRHVVNWAARVRRLLRGELHGFPALAEVATRLHLSPRTLHRRLVAEGTSYMALLDELRHRRAVTELIRNKSSIQEIAFGLGYTDMANFRRAFKRWEGIAPSEYRRNNREP